MIKHILLALSCSLLLPVASLQAQTTKAKTAVKEAKEAVKETAKKETSAKKETTAPKKTEEVSEADKALQESATKQAAKLTAAQNTKLLKLLNTGDSAALQEVEGLGEAKAGAVIKKRPYTKVEDAIMVDGIGEATFGNLVAWAKAEQPKVEEKKATPAKAEEKKPAAKTEEKKAPAPKKEETKPAPKKKTNA